MQNDINELKNVDSKTPVILRVKKMGRKKELVVGFWVLFNREAFFYKSIDFSIVLLVGISYCNSESGQIKIG